MKKPYVILIVLFALLVFAFSIISTLSIFFGSSSSELNMEKAINFEARLIDGTDFQLNDLKGDYVLLDFWGSWCGPCRRANKGVVELHNAFHGKTFTDADGFEIVSVASESDSSRWQAAIEADKLYWKHHIMSLRSDKDRISKKYGIQSIPAPILIAPDGKIIGFKWSNRKMKKYLNKKLR